VAAQCRGKIIAPLEYGGTANHHVFETRFENVLLARLPERRIIIMDNASFRRKKALHELAQLAKSKVVFLPAYSPDLNPIEKTWANLKAFLRNYAFSFDNIQYAISDYFKVK
jgi:transposase